MIPSTVGADLDHIALADRLSGLDAGHLFLTGDTTSVFRKAGPEEVGDLDEVVPHTYRARRAQFDAAELRVAAKFTLRVADLFGRQVAFAPGLET